MSLSGIYPFGGYAKTPRMGWHQYTPSSNSTTPESNKSVHGVSSLQIRHVLRLVSLLTACDGKQREEVAHFMPWGADEGMHERFIRRVQVHGPNSRTCEV